jgi:feruloyl esterase
MPQSLRCRREYNSCRMTTRLLAVVLIAASLPVGAATCDSLRNLSLSGATINSAQTVGAGEFAPPQGGPPGGGAAFKALPAFCRVSATLRPSADSQIGIEVWLPASGWNGNLQSVGNGAWAGTISYPALATALAEGYAGASTDTGHAGNNADFITGHPDKVIDFSYRAVHELTVAAKGIVAAFYGNQPKYSIWNGCSTGGRQAFSEAQRYPADYDGVIAGAPAFHVTRLQGQQVWVAAEAHRDEAAYIPPAKYPALHKAVLDACDALDGVKDGVLENPERCHFDPSVLACKGADGPDCLTAPQVEFAKKMYAGPGMFPGIEPGAELGWNMLAGPKPMGLAVEVYKYLVFNDPNWDFKTFDASKDIAKAEKTIRATMDSSDPNLKPFIAHGSKLLIYHGWADPGVPPMGSVNYYKSVVETVGKKATDSVRLFMVPGMGHCAGGDGTDKFNMVKVLQEWVSSNHPPERIEASHMTKGQVDKTRPLCAYPQVAVFTGSGSTNEAANFVCKAQ